MTYPLKCLLASLLSHQGRASWNECNKWTAWYVGPKVNQTELWKLRNQYLSLMIFHFNVHDFSELGVGIALCLAISKRYKQRHREKYSHEISILVMQNQDNIKILMKFPSVLTFSNTTWESWRWEGMQCSLGREQTQPTPEQPRQTKVPYFLNDEKKEHPMLDAKNQGHQWWSFPEATVNLWVITVGQAEFRNMENYLSCRLILN